MTEKWAQGEVLSIKHWTESLYSIRISAPEVKFIAGQYTKISLNFSFYQTLLPFQGFRSVKSPPPTFRPPPPMVPPPPTPASPMTQRKRSVNAPFDSSPKHSPNPPPGGFLPKRPIEKMEDNKITRFGEPRMKSLIGESFSRVFHFHFAG